MHTTVNHPLVRHKLALLRDTGTCDKQFRELIGEISMFLTYEAMRDIATVPVDVQTPLAVARCERLAGDIVVIPILRAGVGMLDPILSMVPNARVGFIGMYRDHDTAQPVEYYAKLPPATPGARVFVLDPMLATGGSSSAAISQIKARGFADITFIGIVSCPEGIARLEADHPDVAIYTACVDDGLNADKYILPGLGDAGDRIYGTK